jgi:hypothetical protein
VAADPSREFEFDDGTSDVELSWVEQLVDASADYLEPSDDLRPRSVEAARERESHEQRQRGWAASLLAAGVAVALASVAATRLGPRIDWTAPRIVEEHRGRAVPMEARTLADWPLVDAFERVREVQAERLRHPRPQNDR